MSIRDLKKSLFCLLLCTTCLQIPKMGLAHFTRNLKTTVLKNKFTIYANKNCLMKKRDTPIKHRLGGCTPCTPFNAASPNPGYAPKMKWAIYYHTCWMLYVSGALGVFTVYEMTKYECYGAFTLPFFGNQNSYIIMSIKDSIPYWNWVLVSQAHLILGALKKILSIFCSNWAIKIHSIGCNNFMQPLTFGRFYYILFKIIL